MIVFGPVPSRRLGQSLGINNIPPKTCTYSCVYCQIGRTNRMCIDRRDFYSPEDIFVQTEKKIRELHDNGEHLDYITYVADGEPTLDKNLGNEINLLKQFGIRVAVITNASLLWKDDVKKDLEKADWVSLKIDAVASDTWKRVDRPHGYLDMDKILASTIDFAQSFHGTLVTETMLVSGYNDSKESIGEIGKHIGRIKPSKAFLLVPTRPPAESEVKRPSKQDLKDAYNIIHKSASVDVECITEDEGESFFLADDIVNDLLSIISVHPVRGDVIDKLLMDRNIGRNILNNLIGQGLIQESVYEDRVYYRKSQEKENRCETYYTTDSGST